MAQNKKARAQQKLIAVNTSEEVTPASAYAHFNKSLPKKKTDLNKVVSHLCQEYKKPDDPTSVSNVHLNAFRRIYDIGMRENIYKLPEVVCPKCKEVHKIKCTECGHVHELDILDSTKEKTSMAALTLMANKWFPNKAPVTQEFDQVKIIEKITDYVSKLIAILTPELQKTYTEMWIKVISDLEQDA